MHPEQLYKASTKGYILMAIELSKMTEYLRDESINNVWMYEERK